MITNVFPMNDIFAKLNPDNVENTDQDTVKGVVVGVGTLAGGVLLGPLAGLVSAFNVIIFSALYTIFTAVGTTGGAAFPFPDQIVFNKIAFFDPNFINPTIIESAPISILNSFIGNMYYTFYSIALLIFVVSAVIIGIKLAISSIASEKAQYKQALTNWVFGIVLLFTVHFIIAGIFAVNEQIVEIASNLVSGDTFEFSFSIFEGLPFGIGNAINKLTGGSALSADGAFGAIKVQGYGGLILMFVVKGSGGDMVAAIICSIILGQTCALVVQYTKRLFYCIVLGMLAPLIVAVDVIKKSMG